MRLFRTSCGPRTEDIICLGVVAAFIGYEIDMLITPDPIEASGTAVSIALRHAFSPFYTLARYISSMFCERLRLNSTSGIETRKLSTRAREKLPITPVFSLSFSQATFRL